MKDPVHGVDYLVDYYALLQVPRDASPKAIKAGYRKQAQQYHTDIYERTAQKFKSEAQQRMNVINDAATVLLDRSKRKSYDDQLAKWKGPISTDGTPILSLSSTGWDVSRLLATSFEPAPETNPQLEMVSQMIGWNPVIHKVLLQQYEASENPSADLIAALDSSLLQYSQFLQIQQAFKREALGIAGTIPPIIGNEHLALEQRELTQRREAVSREVTEIMTAITRGEVKVIGPAAESVAEQVAANPAATVARYRQLALERFDVLAESIVANTAKQADVVRQRLALTELQYRPAQQPLHAKVALCIRSGDKILWQAWKLEGLQVNQDFTVPPAVLRKLEKEPAAAAMVKSGRNVLFVTRPEGLEPQDVLEEALNMHFQDFLGLRPK